MGSLADCLKSTTVDKATSAQIRKLARKYAKTMPPAEADRRAAAELLDTAMSDMETLRSQLVGLGYDVAVQGGYAAQRDISTAGATTASEAEEAARLWAEMGTESPYFKKWFGDSKVVDEQGTPLVVYHGRQSIEGLEQFDMSERDAFAGRRNVGAYFTSNQEYAASYPRGSGNPTVAVYLNLQNPLITDDYSEMTRVDQKRKEELEALGYDGVVYRDEDIDEYLAFSPTQIKSATGNRGTFDANDPRIMYQSADRQGALEQYKKDPNVFWHGSPSGSLVGADYGIHVGTYRAAEEALNARIGIPASGYWDGTRTYGETLLAGKKRIAELGEYLTGFNADAPEEDYYPGDSKRRPKYSSGQDVDFSSRPVISPVKIVGEMSNHRGKPMADTKANAQMKSMKKRGTAKRGYFYTNEGEDAGSISAVVPSREHLEEMPLPGSGRALFQSAFHGSPYRFDKFTLDAIGTGEGAQAYGWGLYFAGKKEVAEFYREQLAVNMRRLRDITSPFDGESAEYAARKLRYSAKSAELNGRKSEAREYEEAALWVEKGRPDNFGGQLYEVDIPEDDMMLQWDKPLSEQPEKVLEALAGLPWWKNMLEEQEQINEQAGYQYLDRENRLTGEQLYHGLQVSLGGDREASISLNSLGIKGIKYLDGTSRADGDGSYNYVIFDDAAVEILNTFYQNRWTVPSGAQGMISFGTRSGKPLIQLFESANESTFLHETGHLYLEMIRAMATQPNAPAPIVQIWNDTKAALGMESDDLSVKDHENWARNLEAYFAEGKTPSLGLRKLFTRYAEWLKNIYREVERIFTISGTQMNEDLRPIFDRLFATEQEIKETEAFYEAQKPFFTAADQMAEEDRKKYDKLRNKAVESTHDKRLRQLTEASVKAQGGREAFTTEAREQVDRMPVYNAIESARAEGGIDVETLDELVGEKMRKELGKRWNKIGGAPIVVPAGGVDPELLASQHGYESALAMVQDMLAAPPKGQMVKDIVDNRVAQEREKIARGLLDGGTLPADEAYHNEDRMALLLAEFTLLADTMSKSAGARARAIDSAAVREVAKQTLKGYTVSDATDYMRFSRSERKAAIEARLAKEKGAATKALEAKRREMLNHALFLESMQIRKDIAKIEAFMKRTAKQKNLGEDARELARGLGIQYGVIPFRGLTGDKAWQAYGAWFAEQEKERQTLEAWASKYADLYAPYFDPYILSNAGATSYRDLTVEQFVSLRNAVDTIKAVDKQERTIQLAGEAQEREDFIRELSSTLANLKPRSQTRSYKKNKARKAIASYLANHTKAETLLQYLDNWNPDGPWSRLYRALADAEAEQTTRLKPASEELRRIFSPIKKNLGKTVALPALNDSFTRGELFVAFLNMGNEGNLLRLKEGYGWTDAQLEAIKNELTKEEMDAAQAVWDFIDTFREESFAVEKRMNGRTPERVVPTPVATRNGAYRGGYFPISYDADLSETAFMREQKDLDQTLFGGRNYGAAQTKQGHLKERAAGGGGQAIALDLSVITNHVYNVIHDITHREAVVNVAKIIKDPEVKSLMEAYLGVEGYREMWPWLQSVARDVQEPMNQLHRWARWARKGTTIMQMGLKITTMIQQPLGILQTVDVIGKEYAMRGLTYMYGQPSKFPEKAQLVMEKSKFMENRIQAFDRDVRDAMKGLTLKDSVMQEVERFAYKGIGMAQMGVDLPTWWGAYEKAMHVEYKDVQDADAREKKAIAYADSAVRTSQGSGSTLDLSRIQRGGEFQRLLTMFYSYFNTLYNLTYRRSKQTTSYKDVPQLAASAMLLWFLPAVLSDLVSGRGPDDDDEWLSWAAQKIGLYPLQMLVGVRDVANAAFGEFGYQLTPAESAPKSIVNWFKAVKKAIEEGEPERLVKPTAEAIGFIAHLPLKQPLITIGNIWDYATGKDSEFQVRDLFFPKPESRRR